MDEVGLAVAACAIKQTVLKIYSPSPAWRLSSWTTAYHVPPDALAVGLQPKHDEHATEPLLPNLLPNGSTARPDGCMQKCF